MTGPGQDSSASGEARQLVGGRALLPDFDHPVPATVVWSGERIVAVDRPGGEFDRADALDVTGRWILPGIVDLHGDAFERCLMPRPGVEIDIDLALADNDTQLLAAGITTSFLSATDSWEPGLRSRQTLRRLIEALARRGEGPDVRLHVRHERCHTDDPDELAALVRSGRLAMLSYNDHTDDEPDRISMTQIQRTGLAADELEAMQAERAAQRTAGASQEEHLARLARQVGCPTASHDPHLVADLERDLLLGVDIAEFPSSIELARRYQDAGIPVVLGAPNLVRGGSHLGNLSVAEALAAGAGDILCSDYHYPSLLQAPFVAAAQGLASFGPAWRQASETPARAAGLADRGRLEPGQRADLVVVDPPRLDPARIGPARIEQVVVGGSMFGRRP